MKRHSGSVWGAVAVVLAAVFACGGDTLNDVGDVSGGTGGGGPGGSAGTSDLPGGAACGCLPDDISWQSIYYAAEDFEGDSSHLGCTTYRRERRTWQYPNHVQVELCSTEVVCQDDGMGSAVGIVEIQSALLDLDVISALESAPVFYGSDPRPDEAIVQLMIGGALIEIGAPCGGYPNCTEVPEGVYRLHELLWRLEAHELMRGSCTERCPDSPVTESLGEPCSKYGLECPSDNSGCEIYCKNGVWAPLSETDPDCMDQGGGGFAGSLNAGGVNAGGSGGG